jgi:hypothetical protein
MFAPRLFRRRGALGDAIFCVGRRKVGRRSWRKSRCGIVWKTKKRYVLPRSRR